MIRFPEHSRVFLMQQRHNKHNYESYVFHYRPEVIPFLKRCLAHCHVAFMVNRREDLCRTNCAAVDKLGRRSNYAHVSSNSTNKNK